MKRKKRGLSDIINKITDADVRAAILDIIIEIVKAHEKAAYVYFNNSRELIDINKKLASSLSSIQELNKDEKISFEVIKFNQNYFDAVKSMIHNIEFLRSMEEKGFVGFHGGQHGLKLSDILSDLEESLKIFKDFRVIEGVNLEDDVYKDYTFVLFDRLESLATSIVNIGGSLANSGHPQLKSFNDLIEKRKQESLEAGGKW